MIKALEQNNELDNTLIVFFPIMAQATKIVKIILPAKTIGRQKCVMAKKSFIRETKSVAGSSKCICFDWCSLGKCGKYSFSILESKNLRRGICTPMIVHWPKGIEQKKGSINSEIAHVIDIMATCLDVSNSPYPSQYRGYSIIPSEGMSLLPVFKTGKRNGHREICFEHFNEKAMIDKAGWKIVMPAESKKWELYNLNVDISELDKLAEQYPRE